MPMVSVAKADATTMQTTIARASLEGSPSLVTFSQRGKIGRTPQTITAMNKSTNSRLIAEPVTLEARAIATTSASTLQAVTSSTAAQVTAMLPRKVFERLRSCKMRARTGNAVMLIEIPMNKANAVNVAPGAARDVYRNHASATPKK